MNRTWRGCRHMFWSCLGSSHLWGPPNQTILTWSPNKFFNIKLYIYNPFSSALLILFLTELCVNILMYTRLIFFNYSLSSCYFSLLIMWLFPKLSCQLVLPLSSSEIYECVSLSNCNCILLMIKVNILDWIFSHFIISI